MPRLGATLPSARHRVVAGRRVARARPRPPRRSSFAMRKVSSSNPVLRTTVKRASGFQVEAKPTLKAGVSWASRPLESLNGTQSTECCLCCADGGSAPYGSPPLRREREFENGSMDVIVLGDGPAALHAAAEAANRARDLMMSSTGLGTLGMATLRSHRSEANNRSHREDTIRCGAFLCDQDVVAE